MKKNTIIGVTFAIVVVLLLGVIIVTRTGNKGEKYLIEDAKYGTVEFTYDKETSIKLDSKEEGDDNKSSEYRFSSEKLNFDAKVYFIQNDSIESTKDRYKDKTGYQELSFNKGKYKGFSYSQTKVTSTYDVYIDVYDYSKDDDEMYDCIMLYISLEKKNSSIKTNLKDVINSDEVQNILNTMIYRQTEK